MRTSRLFFSAVFFLALFFPAIRLCAQEEYTYQLSQDFHGTPSAAPDLIQIPNNSNLTGEFVPRTVPATTCGQTGISHGYFFNDDSGLKFYNPSGFINQSYSIAFNFQVDEFISPPAWVRILSFTHTDDVGVYIQLTNPPTNGTLEFWPYGTVGTTDFFTTVNFYQIILVRDDAGLIKIYVNGQEFSTYDDGQTQKYVPQPPDNWIVWFRDDPSVLANEASPGFVQNIILANYTWTLPKIQEVWQKFCSSLLSVDEIPETDIQVYPNPAKDLLFLDVPPGTGDYRYSIADVTGQCIVSVNRPGSLKQSIDISRFSPGIYFLRVISEERSQVFRFIKK
jgi:hypothetical protein